MGRRRGDATRAYTFDLEPDAGDESADRGHEPVPPSSVSEVSASPPAAGSPSTSWGDGSPVVIDLDAALDESFGSSGAEPTESEQTSPGTSSGILGKLRAQPRGRLLAAAAVATVLGAGAAVADAVVDHNQETGLREAPGGVVDLATQPEEVWSLEGSERRGTGLIATMGRLVVVQDSYGLAAVDSKTGQQRWRVGGMAGLGHCGPGPDYLQAGIRAYSTDLVVCIYGGRGSDASTVAVIDREGSVVSRRTVDRPLVSLFPGVDGGLLSATWVGEADESRLSQLVIDPQTGSLSAGQKIADGYDLEVRLEDAATGEVRWEREVAFEPVVDPYLCVRWEGSSSDEEVEIDLQGGLTMGATPRLIWVTGCGIDASFTPSGTRLDRPATIGPGRDVMQHDHQGVRPLVDGGYLVRWDTRVDGVPPEPDKLLRPDGSVVREVDGDVLDPWATNGTGRGLHLLRMGSDTVAVDRGGEELWRAEIRSVAFLVRTRGVLVVADDTLHLHGLDPGTGERRWTSEQALGAQHVSYDAADGMVQSVFTDGRVAALVLPDWDSSNRRWIAFDLASGAVQWEREYTGTGWGAEFALDGRIVRWSPNGLAGLG